MVGVALVLDLLARAERRVPGHVARPLFLGLLVEGVALELEVVDRRVVVDLDAVGAGRDLAAVDVVALRVAQPDVVARTDEAGQDNSPDGGGGGGGGGGPEPTEKEPFMKSLCGSQTYV